MSAWRRKAIELFPELRREIESRETTITTLFFDLVERCRAAHERDDGAELARIYGFAQWCLEQRAKDLWNAAGVAFYEHLADSRRTLHAAFPRWVSRAVFEEIASLLEARLGAERVAELRGRYLD